MTTKIKTFFSLLLTVGLISSNFAVAAVTPPMVDEVLALNESFVVDKTVGTIGILPTLDVCLLEDETGSFGDDIANLQGGTTASDIYDNIVASSSDAYFAVAGFRDYPVSPYGSAGDHVYHLLQSMSSVKADWLNGIAALGAGGGNDTPEAQYDAIVAAAGPGSFNDPEYGPQDPCGWRDDPNVTRVLVVATDAPFHTPDGTHVNDAATTIAALNAQNITVIGLKAPGAGGELDALAAATGGSVQSLSPSGSDIADAILAGLSNLPVTVIPVDNCSNLDVTFDPASQTATSGEPVIFEETITVPNDPALAGTVQICSVEFQTEDGEVLGTQDIRIRIPVDIDLTPESEINELGFENEHTVIALIMSGLVPVPEVMTDFDVLAGPNAGETYSEKTDENGESQFSYRAKQGNDGLGTDIIMACGVSEAGERFCDRVRKEWVDTTPPKVACVETTNPHGKNIPPAGSTTLPGSKGGQNEDGFYELLTKDVVDPNGSIYVEDTESGIVFGPFENGTKIKYTEANSLPRQKKIGSDKGEAGAVLWHITGNGDAAVYAVDFSGNESEHVSCLVPPLPK